MKFFDSVILKFKHLKYGDYYLIITLCAIVNTLLFFRFGIQYTTDSLRYLEYADHILEKGFYFEVHNFWYIGYVLYLVFLKSMGLGFGAIVMGQILLSAIASLSIYKSVCLLTGRNIIGLLSASSFLLWIELSQWNFYILAESLNISFTAIAIYLILRLKNFQSWNGIALLIIVLYTFFIKPTGISLMISFLLISLYKITRQPS